MSALDHVQPAAPPAPREDPGAAPGPPRAFACSLRPAERRLRWFIVGWITLSTILNLINRNTLAILAPTFSSKFSGVSFTDAPGLAQKLRSSSDPVSLYLRSQLTAASLQVLADPAATAQQQQAVLIEELNRIARRGPLYEAQRFAGVAPSPQTIQLQAEDAGNAGRHPVLEAVARTFQLQPKDPQTEHWVRLNRSRSPTWLSVLSSWRSSFPMP